MNKTVRLFTLFALGIALAAPRDVAAVDTTATFDPGVLPCSELTPTAFDVGGVTDDGARIHLDVAVLEDGVARDMVTDALNHAAEIYRPLGIDLRVAQRRTVNFPSDGTNVGPDGVTRPTGGARDFFDSARRVFGGLRPPGADVVYVVTSKDVYEGSSSSRGSYGIAGFAECIGGVRFADRAFAVGEVLPVRTFGPIRHNLGTARVLAHEIGHLMGAHHHYSECVSGVVDEPSSPEATPCTLMTTDVGLASSVFSATNGLMVRGHASHWARP